MCVCVCSGISLRSFVSSRRTIHDFAKFLEAPVGLVAMILRDARLISNGPAGFAQCWDLVLTRRYTNHVDARILDHHTWCRIFENENH